MVDAGAADKVNKPSKKKRSIGKRKASEKSNKKDETPFGAVKLEDANAPRKGHVVWVGQVPPSLCASERTVRDLFGEYGMLLSIKIHHNFVDMSVGGFLYLEYSSKQEAETAVAAVKEQRVGGAIEEFKVKQSVGPRTLVGMKAEMGLGRGEPQVNVDEEIRDLLLGRRQVNRFSQQTENNDMDEEDMMLQSLSQHSFPSSQPRKKRKKSKKASKHSQD